MPTYRLNHLYLASADIPKTAGFYEKLLRTKIIRARQTSVYLYCDGVRRNVRETPLVPGYPVGNGFEHLALQTNNIEGVMKEMKANGVTIALIDDKRK